MFYDWLIRRRMPLTYVHWVIDYIISWMPPCHIKDLCDKWLQRSIFFVKTANIKVVSNLGKCKNYAVMEIENFLSADVCDHIIETAKQKGIVDSTIIDDRGTRVLDLFTRKSKQTWLTDSESQEVQTISERVSMITDMPKSHQEDMQVVAYPAGGYYNPHFDASFHPDVIPNMNRGCGPRLYTFLIYLNDDYEGGETDFPEIGVTIKPKKGKAILFQNIDANQDLIPESMHAGCPVKNGTKWIANKWIRVWPFELATLTSAQPPISNRPVRFPKTLDMVKQNIVHYNWFAIPQCKLDQCEILHIPSLFSRVACDHINQRQNMDVVDKELNVLLETIIPIPTSNKQMHFSPLCIGATKGKNGFGLKLARMYIMVSETSGSIVFPYLDRTYKLKQGDALIVHELDEMLLYNVASSHFIDIPLDHVVAKFAYTIPLSYRAMLDDREGYAERAYAHT